MVLKLYGDPRTPATRRAAIVFHEKDIPYEFHRVSLAKGEHKISGYIAQQPFGQVPYVVRLLHSNFIHSIFWFSLTHLHYQDDDGVIIFESRAISRYIEAKYASKGPRLALPPSGDLATYARFEQACSIEQANFETLAAAAAAELIFNSCVTFNLPRTSKHRIWDADSGAVRARATQSSRRSYCRSSKLSSTRTTRSFPSRNTSQEMCVFFLHLLSNCQRHIISPVAGALSCGPLPSRVR
jgi:glutathione S-transferase